MRTFLLRLLRLPWKALLKTAAEAALKTELGELTRSIVAEIEMIYDDLPGIEKHKLAVERITGEAQKLGWGALREAVVNLLIELAVYLRKQLFSDSARSPESRTTTPGGEA